MAMDQQPGTDKGRHFEGLPDPRTGNAKTHIFLKILIIAICAVICGAEDWSEVELLGRHKKEWLKMFLKLSKGIPLHDSLGRVFAKIKPEEFQRRCIEWVLATEKQTAGQVIAVDGTKFDPRTIRVLGKQQFPRQVPGQPKTNLF